LKENEILLRRNVVQLKLPSHIKNRGEILDNITRLQVQRPNSISWTTQQPMRLWYYNLRYNKFQQMVPDSLPNSAEPPVIFDSSTISRTVQNIKNYLFNLGYFYVSVHDSIVIAKKQATVVYKINTGDKFLINSLRYNVDDKAMSALLNETKAASSIKKGVEYSVTAIEEERSRIVAAMRNNGYYHFTQDNIETFQLDTLDKDIFSHIENPFANLVQNIVDKSDHRIKHADLEIIIRKGEDKLSYDVYRIGKVNVYADYKAVSDSGDKPLFSVVSNKINFYFHDFYVHTAILQKNIFIASGHLFEQAGYDKTYAKLNELGLFQFIKIEYTENTDTANVLDCNIYLIPVKKYDFATNTEASSGTTYDLGLSQSFSFHNKNFEKGANLFSISLNGGIEYVYDGNYGNTVYSHFKLLTEYYGINASIDMPKFLSLWKLNYFDNKNLPHTILTLGSNIIDRVDYFTLLNTTASYIYNWRKTKSVTWTFSPGFINVVMIPKKTQSFQTLLDNNPLLKDTYSPNFIEGENISLIYNDADVKHNINYSYIKLGFEEAGGVLGIVNFFGLALNDLFKIKYAQYSKFDFDIRHFFNIRKNIFAVRITGGVGLPYGQSSALPYIKQFFVGGPYSLRGWQIRTLGPGSYKNTAVADNTLLDNTGDIKLDMTGEYRFPVAPLFAGSIKLNAALFADAGNIWLEKKDANYPGGEFELTNLGQTIAMDVGAGLRFDIASFLTLRCDVAMPVKQPNIFFNDGWVLNKIDFNNAAWRTENLVLNIAVGYPF
jgi:outer membrane protein insertion porin family